MEKRWKNYLQVKHTKNIILFIFLFKKFTDSLSGENSNFSLVSYGLVIFLDIIFAFVWTIVNQLTTPPTTSEDEDAGGSGLKVGLFAAAFFTHLLTGLGLVLLDRAYKTECDSQNVRQFTNDAKKVCLFKKIWRTRVLIKNVLMCFCCRLMGKRSHYTNAYSPIM